jgi:NADPH:quinone reductase-like Zn-dependent oxidoreductase
MATGQGWDQAAQGLNDLADAPIMHAIVQHGYGSADVLHVEQIPRPRPADNEVLVRVSAASLSRGTWHLMSGRPYVMRLGLGLRAPKNSSAGQDLAGTVVATGSAVTRFVLGDDVFGVGHGSFAEYAIAREDKLARKPVNISFEQAASVPVSGSTALQGLRDVGRLARGQNVLIIGASGGVGTFAVQLAKAFGAHVTAVCSTRKLDLVRAIGADRVIDYTTTDFSAMPDRYDLILDIGGNATLRRLRRALTPRGTLVIVGGEDSGDWVGMGRQLRAMALSPFTRQQLSMFIATQNFRDLEQLTELIESGAIAPALDRTFTLDQLPEAMRYLQAGDALGKIAITI